MDSELFEKQSPNKLLFRCAIPSIITMVFGSLFSITDGFFVGRYLGEEALAAINIVMPILMIIEAVSNMIATGASVHISVLLGEKKREEASDYFSTSLLIIFAVSCIIGLACFVFAGPIVTLISRGADKLTTDYAVEHLRVFALFSPVFPLFFATDNYLRACGKEKLSMLISVSAEVINIVLDFIFIAFLNMGILAAALTSCVSMTLGALVTLFGFNKNRTDLYYTKNFVNIRNFLKAVYNGVSEFFSNISMSVMSLIMNVFLLKYGGVTALAAFSVIMYVDGIVGMLIFGLCDALQPAISHCYGAKLYGKVKAIFARVVVASIVLSALSMLFMFFVGEYVAPVFIKPEDVELLKVSVVAMKIFAFSYICGWVDTCFSSFFSALERPMRSLIVSVCGTLVLPIASLFVLTRIFMLEGIWLMPAISCTVSAVITLLLAFTMKMEKCEV